MHPQSTEQQAGTVRIAFDINAGVDPQTFPADATTAQITDRLREAFLAADVIRDGHEFAVVIEGGEMGVGTVKVLVDGNVIEHGSITPVGEQPAVEPHADLAAVLRCLALDIIDSKLPLPRHYFTLRACLASRADVQAWADHYGVPVTMGGTAGDIPCASQDIEFGDGRSIRIAVQGPTEQAPDPEKAALAARVAELEAQLAKGVPTPPTNPDRRCHRCGATSGLRLLPGNPLVLADREWQCVDQCAGGAR